MITETRGQKIQDEIDENWPNRETVAEEAGVSLDTVNRACNDENVGSQKLEAIAKTLGIKIILG